MIWEPLFLVAALAVPGVWAWYISGCQIAATTEPEQRRVLRLTVAVSAGIGIVILALGVVVFLLQGHNWLVLALIWAVGLFHLGVVTLLVRLGQRRTSKKGQSASR